MKNFIIKHITVFMAVVLMLALPGCKNDNSAANSTPPRALEGKNLHVVTSYGANDGAHEMFKDLCAEFQDSTGAEIVNDASDSTEDWKQNVRSMFAGVEEPDVLFFFTGTDVEPLIQEGKFVSFDEIRKQYSDYASNINLMVLDSLRASDGKDYAVPIKGYWERLFVNLDIFNELELELPKTYDDLLKLAPQLTEYGYVPIAASLNEVPHYLFEAFLYNETGPSNHHNIPSDPDNLPESWITALNRFTEAYAAGLFPNDDAQTHADAFELFQSKKAAMIVDGDWSVASVRDTENVAVIDFPSSQNPARKSTDLISGFSMGFYITRTAWEDDTKRDAAVRFVQFITSNSSIMRLNVSGAAMPISVDPSDSDHASSDDANVTPLLGSIQTLNQKTTAFVGAVADEFNGDARAWLFSQIPPLSRGELNSQELLREFIIMNSDS